MPVLESFQARVEVARTTERNERELYKCVNPAEILKSIS